MDEISEKINIQQNPLLENESSGKDEYDKEINIVIRREEVMNSVLEKLIDKLKQPHAMVSKGKR
jgi:hypothetical protein